MDDADLTGRIREWMNEGSGRWVCALAAGGVLVLAIGIYAVRSVSDEGDAIRQKGQAALYVCAKCGESGEMRVPFGPVGEIAARFPIDCPKCGASKAAALAITCSGCGKRFARPAKAVFKCPHCQKVYDNTIPPE